LEVVVERIIAAGGKASAVIMDVADAESVEALLGAVQDADILVNNAGIASNAAALDIAEADWDAVMNANLKGAFLVAQMVASAMKAHGRGGSVINIAAILGLRQSPGALPYAVSKAGLIQMTKVLALELARFSIRVNAIAPGYLRTDLNQRFLDSPAGHAMVGRIPMRRVGHLHELDGPLLLLASDASAYMTGSVLTVDGGHMVSSL
jgi:NAD(P)-dependent dehydrogenase (short-subunit alcohol dehydrogenase family)